MRILVVYPYFCTPKGSWSTRWYELALRWVNKGRQLSVITSAYEKSDMPKGFSSLNIEGIEVSVIPFADNNRSGAFWRFVNAAFFSLCASFKALTGKYDVLISSSGPISTLIPLLLAKKFRKKKVVFEIRDIWPEVPIQLGKLKHTLLKKAAFTLVESAYQHSDLVICCSPGQFDFIKANYKTKVLHMVSNGADSRLFEPALQTETPSWAKGKKILLHMGSLGFIHNAGYWLEVARYIKDDSILFLYIGEGAERKELELRVHELGIHNVRFLGLLPKQELYKWTGIAKASLFSTLPFSLQETCSPNKIYDSFAAHLPIIQTTKGWIFDLINTKGGGINVDVNQAETAAAQIEELLNNTDRLSILANEAFDLYRNNFNYDLLANQYLTYLDKLYD